MMHKAKQDLAGHHELIYEAALRYLNRRDYSVAELTSRLMERGAPADEVSEVIHRLLDSGYLSDERFAAGRVRERRDFSRRGRLAVRSELRQLGVDEELIDTALADEYSEEQERKVAAELVARAMPNISKLTDPDLQRKRLLTLQRRLLARGFRPETVWQLIQQFKDE